MRIVIDLQGAQSDSRFRGIGRYSLSLALAMARNAGEHELWIALNAALAESNRDALTTGWILDCDATLKLLYGHQDGVGVGYNPTKQGRPSPTLHTDWIAHVRRVLDAEVQDGKALAAKHRLPRLRKVLESLPPKNVRVWCAATTPSATIPVVTNTFSLNRL